MSWCKNHLPLTISVLETFFNTFTICWNKIVSQKNLSVSFITDQWGLFESLNLKWDIWAKDFFLEGREKSFWAWVTLAQSFVSLLAEKEDQGSNIVDVGGVIVRSRSGNASTTTLIKATPTKDLAKDVSKSIFEVPSKWNSVGIHWGI